MSPKLFITLMLLVAVSHPFSASEASMLIFETKPQRTCSLSPGNKFSCQNVCKNKGYEKKNETQRVQCIKQILSTKYTCSAQKYIEGIEEIWVKLLKKNPNEKQQTAIISWKPVDIKSKKEVKYGYSCNRYYKNNEDYDMKDFFANETTDTKIEIPNLRVGQSYYCKVRVIHNNRFSRYKKVDFQTQEQVPTTAPLSMEVDFITNSSFKLRWKEPLESNGNITAYVVQINATNSDVTISKTIVGGTTAELVVTEQMIKKINSEFVNISVAAENRIGRGPYAMMQVLLPPYDTYYMEPCMTYYNICPNDCSAENASIAYMTLTGIFSGVCERPVEIGICNP